MSVIGIDASLASTGIADVDGSVHVIRSSEHQPRINRIAEIVESVLQLIYRRENEEALELVVIEGYAYGAQGKAVTKLAELGGVLRYYLHTWEVPWCEVPSSTIKKYATGRGNVNKYAVMIAARERLGYMGSDDNEADALWLRAFGLAMLGRPACVLPQANRAALNGWAVTPDGLMTTQESG